MIALEKSGLMKVPQSSFMHIITSRINLCIDNANSLLVGITDLLTFASQTSIDSTQNVAACVLITKTRKLDHIPSILKDLHWLPILAGIKFKLLIFHS